MAKRLTQTGINRAMWIMLKCLNGRVVIPGRALEEPNVDDAMQIQHDPSTDSFIFTLHKVKGEKKSPIIQPRYLN